MTRLSWALLFCYIFPVTGPAQTPDEIIRQAEASFLSAKTTEAGFKLRITWKLRDTVEEKNGTLFIQEPDKYRVELDDGVFISDGKTFYRYSGRSKQLVLNRVRDLGNDFQPGSWLFKYSDRFTPMAMDSAKVSGEPCFEIALKPGPDEVRFKALKVWISREKKQARKIETTDRNDNTATYLITRLTHDKAFKPSLFSFKAPKGTETIDMRE